jgi:hypothetical protein
VEVASNDSAPLNESARSKIAPTMPLVTASVSTLPLTLRRQSAQDSSFPFATKEPSRASGGWTIPMLCAGIAIIACCVIIPLADANHRLVYEREKLKLNLDQVEKQVGVNDEFLHKIGQDPTLAERLAQRQMKVVRQGTGILELKGQGTKEDTSPFLLVSVPPPAPMMPYRPTGGKFSEMCRTPRTQLYLIGGGLLLIAAGLVLGGSVSRINDS